MELVFKTIFGSHLYGSAIETSDQDIKGVYLPTPKEILLNRIKSSVNIKTNNTNERNSAEDTDEQYFSLDNFIKQLVEAQTGALDMLFAHKAYWLRDPSEEWGIIYENREKLLSKNIKAMIGYSVNQAAKYGIKSSHLHALRELISFIPDSHERLGEYLTKNPITPSEYISVVMIKGPNDVLDQPHLQIRNKKFPFTSTCKHTRDILVRIFDEYGERVRQAENNENVDWKSIMHGIRCCTQGIELLSTGHITFPRPDAQMLRKVRRGEYTYKEAASILEKSLDDLRAAELTSTLRAKPDLEFADDLIFHFYKKRINDGRIL